MAAKLGIIAGGGTLPLRLLEKCKNSGRPYYLLGLKGQIDDQLFVGHQYENVRIGATGKAIDLLKENGVTEIVMAGHVKRPNIAALRPDAKALKVLAKTGAMALGDDGLLKAVIKYLEQDEGFKVVAVASILGDELITPGSLGIVEPSENSLKDIQRGIDVLKIMGPADIGQAVVVQDELVLAVEAVEGTASMLSRCKELRREGAGGVLVKIRKPGQETRIDMPTIGPDTVKQARAAGLSGIAIDAGGMIVLDRQETVAAADQSGLFIFAVDVK